MIENNSGAPNRFLDFIFISDAASERYDTIRTYFKIIDTFLVILAFMIIYIGEEDVRIISLNI